MKNPALTELVRLPGIAKPTVKVLVDRLAEKGCVNRLPFVDGLINKVNSKCSRN